MKEKILKIFGKMKKLFLVILLFPWLMAAQSVDIYGTWESFQDQEILVMDFNGSFERTTYNETFYGTYTLYDDVIHVINNKGQEYDLYYYIDGVTLYIEKPYSNKAWIFTKISN